MALLTDCEIVYCKQNLCENGGTCNPAPGGRTCTCPDGFGGTDCEIVYCTQNPCTNDG